MFKFDKKQEVFKFGNINVGGQPGEYPTVLVSTMFYLKHKIVSDEDKGIFDKDKAEALWKMQEEMGDYSEKQAAVDDARWLKGIETDHLEDLTYMGQKRIHNLRVEV